MAQWPPFITKQRAWKEKGTRNKILSQSSLFEQTEKQKGKNRLWFIISGAFDAYHHNQHLRKNHHHSAENENNNKNNNRNNRNNCPKITITISAIKQF